ncbi:MAG TPA: hypothetical protein VGW34_05570 [Allosphingosinicella sp.]|nr:hypothetical protein [Allosphingosinicella sp.]
MKHLPAFATVVLAACSGAERPAQPVETEARAAMAAADPPAAGQQASPRERPRPAAEAPHGLTSSQAAADILKNYYSLIAQQRYEDAWRLREPGARAPTASQLAAGFADYAEYHANVGAPSEVARAAGSLYVEVPVQTYGRKRDGSPFSSAGTVTMRRPDGDPGAAGAQRRWRIYTGK